MSGVGDFRSAGAPLPVGVRRMIEEDNDVIPRSLASSENIVGASSLP